MNNTVTLAPRSWWQRLRARVAYIRTPHCEQCNTTTTLYWWNENDISYGVISDIEHPRGWRGIIHRHRRRLCAACGWREMYGY